MAAVTRSNVVTNVTARTKYINGVKLLKAELPGPTTASLGNSLCHVCSPAPRLSHCARGVPLCHGYSQPEPSGKAAFAPVAATQSDEADPTAAA